MGQIITQPLFRHNNIEINYDLSTASTDDKGGSLKLAAQKVTDFSGGNEEWRKWKSKTALRQKLGLGALVLLGRIETVC